MEKNIKFYVEWDKDSASYCVFDTKEGKAWRSYSSQEEAEKEAQKMNENRERENCKMIEFAKNINGIGKVQSDFMSIKVEIRRLIDVFTPQENQKLNSLLTEIDKLIKNAEIERLRKNGIID